MSSSPPPPALRRRHWLVIVPAGLVAVGVAAYRFWPSGGDAAQEVTLASIVAGQSIGRWTVVRVGPMHMGAIPVVLETHESQRYQIDVLARDPGGPRGVAETERLSLFVVNSHTSDSDAGQRPTDEEQGLGAIALAGALAREVPPAGLLTMQQRLDRHPDGSFGVALF